MNPAITHRLALIALLAQRGHGAISEDCVQHVAVRWQTHGEGVKYPYPWAKRVALNAAMSRGRSADVRYAVSDTEHVEHAPQIDLRDNNLVGRDIKRVLSRMSEGERFCILAKDYHGYAVAELADMLGIKVSAAKVRLCRARARFRRLYRAMEES